jgi:hypothetical protein
VLNVLHDELLALGKLERCEGVGLANDGNDVNAWAEAAHKLNVELAKSVTLRTNVSIRRESS